ncbi:MAG: recombination mediator RecR [Candidatus Methylacidiphilales bacterium]|nr:recombination mediator RecR [Candidatus Methylacidiphilales bacterium]
MLDYPPSLRKLIAALRELPGVGPRSAERMALHLLKTDPGLPGRLAESLLQAAQHIRPCTKSRFLSENGRSSMFDDPHRDPALLCIVEHDADVLAFEKSGAFKGHYFVLGGCLSPLDDIGPEELHIPELLRWVRGDGVREVILGLGADTKGETTSLYLTRELKQLGVKVTRLATGVSIGSSLEYTDALTLTHALQDRKEL